MEAVKNEFEKLTTGKKKMEPEVHVTEDSFGHDPLGRPVRRFTLINENRMSVQVINYGAIITCIKVPDRRGNVDDIVLGFDDMNGFINNSGYLFGATVGRVSNRIYPADFLFNREHIFLSKNSGDIHLHGGINGFDKALWDAVIDQDRVIMTYVSPDGEEGYPGTVLATVIFQLTPDNRLAILMKAAVSKPTLVNFTNHTYFNIAGHASGGAGLLRQYLTVNADKYTVAEKMVCTGEIRDVADTVYELRTPKNLKTAIEDVVDEDGFQGFDINYCLNNSTIQPGFNFAARIEDPESGRYMEVHTDQPGMQLYTSNKLSGLKGKRDAVYGQFGGICFETQKYPNAINIDTFPSIIVQPGTDYSHLVTYSFGILPPTAV